MKKDRKALILSLCLLVLTAGCGQEKAEEVSEFQESVEQSVENAEVAPNQESQVESEVPSEPETPPEPEVITLTISAAGDVTLGNMHTQGYEGTFRKEYDTQQNPGYFMENVKSIFDQDDMTIVNFEGVLTLTDERVEKRYNMKGDPAYVEILNEGSIEAVSFANNHRMDYGQQGSDDTVEAFEQAGIMYAYNENLGYYSTKGLTIGFVSVNEASEGTAVESYLEEGIATLQENQVDLIIVCCHWGEETHHYPENYQETLGRKCIDWGADLVLGHHPHVLQGIEEYNGKYIVYSLGNFCFGGNRNPKDKDTMIFQQTFTFIDGELQVDDNIQVIPCSISSVSSRNNYQPTPATGEEKTRIMEKLNKYCERYDIFFTEEGKLQEG